VRPHDTHTHTHTTQGNYYGLKEEHEKAVQYFSRAIRLNPKFLSAYILMGHEYMEMKNIPAAVRAYRKAAGSPLSFFSYLFIYHFNHLIFVRVRVRSCVCVCGRVCVCVRRDQQS